MLDTFRRLLLAASLLLLTGCGDNKPSPAPAPDNGMVPLQVGVLNYTDDYIGVVYVNGSWAGNMLAHGGGVALPAPLKRRASGTRTTR